MTSKDTFVKIMTAVEAATARLDKFTDLLETSPEGPLYDSLYDITNALIEELDLPDTYDPLIISYCYEHDYGKNYRHPLVYIDGKPYSPASYADLYDTLLLAKTAKKIEIC